MHQQNLTHTTHSVHETLALGEKLGRLLKGGELICLEGELGTGKTCLVRGIAQGLGIDATRISSPTFTIHHGYPGRFFLHHLDLYRIDQPEEIEKLGLLELLDDPKSVIVIEWAEKNGGLLPKECLKIQMIWENENSRRFEIQAIGSRYTELLAQLKAQTLYRQPLP